MARSRRLPPDDRNQERDDLLAHVDGSDHPDSCWTCWSCQKGINERNGISLNGTPELHVCKACWKLVPVTARLALQAIMRDTEQGGLGLQKSFEGWIDMARAAISGWHYPGGPGGDELN